MNIAIATLVSVIAGFILGTVFSAWTQFEKERIKNSVIHLAKAVQGDMQNFHARVLLLESKLGADSKKIVSDLKHSN